MTEDDIQVLSDLDHRMRPVQATDMVVYSPWTWRAIFARVRGWLSS